jgi:hypothetical protein
MARALRPYSPDHPAASGSSWPGRVGGGELVPIRVGGTADAASPWLDPLEGFVPTRTRPPQKELIQRYARRMIIEQRRAEIIRSFCVGALSSTVNLNVDLDIMLAVVAQALPDALGTRLPATQSRPQAPSSARSWKPRPDPYCRLWLTGSPSLTGSSALRWRAVTRRRAPGATGCRGCAARIPAPCARRTSGRAPPTVHRPAIDSAPAPAVRFSKVIDSTGAPRERPLQRWS